MTGVPQLRHVTRSKCKRITFTKSITNNKTETLGVLVTFSSLYRYYVEEKKQYTYMSCAGYKQLAIRNKYSYNKFKYNKFSYNSYVVANCGNRTHSSVAAVGHSPRLPQTQLYENIWMQGNSAIAACHVG